MNSLCETKTKHSPWYLQEEADLLTSRTQNVVIHPEVTHLPFPLSPSTVTQFNLSTEIIQAKWFESQGHTLTPFTSISFYQFGPRFLLLFFIHQHNFPSFCFYRDGIWMIKRRKAISPMILTNFQLERSVAWRQGPGGSESRESQIKRLLSHMTPWPCRCCWASVHQCSHQQYRSR